MPEELFEVARSVVAAQSRHVGCAAQNDGETRIRTGDTTIFSRVLYQLSYLAATPDRSPLPARRTRLAAEPARARTAAAPAVAGVFPRLRDRAADRSSCPPAPASRRPTSRSAGAAPSRPRSARPGTAAARPRRSARPSRRERVGLAVGEHEVEADVGVLDQVVPGPSGLVGRVGDRPRVAAPPPASLRPSDVLAFVDVAVPRCSVAVFGTPEVERPLRPGTRPLRPPTGPGWESRRPGRSWMGAGSPARGRLTSSFATLEMCAVRRAAARLWSSPVTSTW